MKKTLIILSAIFLVLVCAFLYLQTKTEWHASLEAEDNLTEFSEDGETNSRNDFNIENKCDIKISNQALIAEGELTVRYYLNEELLAEKTYTAGNNSDVIAELSQTSGMLTMKTELSSDVKGTFAITVQTRETKWNHWIRKIKENF